MKRMISLLLCMLMVVGILPVQVFAVEEPVTEVVTETKVDSPPISEHPEIASEHTHTFVWIDRYGTVQCEICGLISGNVNPYSDLTFTLFDGILTISGKGDMSDLWIGAPSWRRYADQITEAVVEEGITMLGLDVFRVCVNLKKVSLPSTLEWIAAGSFAYCEQLEELVIPASVTKIEQWAFAEAPNLKITLEEGNTAYFFDELGVLYSRDMSALVWAPYSFEGKYVVPEGVRNVAGAFVNRTKLTEVVLPSTLIDEGEEHFGYSGFSGCTSLQRVTVTEGAVLGSEMFAGCNALREIELPPGANLGNGCFKDCTALREIELPPGVNLGNNCFSNCTALSEIAFSSDGYFGEYCFSGCTSLSKIALPSHGYFGAYCFLSCSALREIELSAGVEVGNGCFCDCTALKKVEIPDGIILPGSLFYGCTSLQEIRLPGDLRNVPSNLVAACESLEQISLPENVESIGSNSLAHGTALTELIIPKNVTEIWTMACSVTDPESLPNNLKTIIFQGDAPAFKTARHVGTGEYLATFANIEATVYYPENNPTWTKEVRRSYGGKITWVPYEYKQTVGDLVEKLEQNQENGTLTEAMVQSVVTEVQNMGAEELLKQLQQNPETLGKLEAMVSGAVKVEAADIEVDASAVSILGAKLNGAVDESKDIVLRIGAPASEKLEISRDYDADVAVRFSMTLENVASVDPLKVPVKIQLPIPAGIDPQRAVILHYAADGSVRQVIEPTISADKKSAGFVLTAFCDFAITQKHQHQFVDGFCACGAKEAADVKRVAGGSRYSTCTAVADELKATLDGKPFDAVVVASGADFPDALAGTYLAAVKKAPILLIADTHIDMMVKYIDKNMADSGTIYILGSENSVSKKAADALSAVGTVKRLGGKSRFITNLRILEEVNTKTGELLVVYSVAPWDALSVSSSGKPILLVNDKLRDDQKQYLETTGFDKITIIGSTAGVPDTMEAELSAYCSNIDRVYGKNRFMTSIEVAEYFYGTEKGSIVVACGTNFPDGLCSGALAHAKKAPVILTDAGRESLVADYVTEYNIQSGYVIGSAKVVSDDSVRKAFHMTETDVIK